MSIYEADEWAAAVPAEAAETGTAGDSAARDSAARDDAGAEVTAGPAATGLRPPLLRVLARGVLGLPRHLARPGQLPLRWRITSAAVLAAGTAAAGMAAVHLAVEAGNDEAVAQARGAALTAARTEIRQILSYDYRSIGSDLARARGDTTGEFRGQFGVLARELIGPAATQLHTVTTATVPDASVISASADRIVVLLFIDQSTVSKAKPQPQPADSQVRVTMQRTGGRWLVAQFQAL